MDLKTLRKGVFNMGRLVGISVFCFAILIVPVISLAKTIVLDGSLKSRIRVSQQMGFNVERPLSKLSFRFALPASFSNKFVFQKVSNLDIRFSPEPSELKNEIDQFGNNFKIVTW
ncbi:MAG: hypothetical protein ACK4TF_09610, partial [Thermodesulfovibrionales bacterium]